MDHPAATLTAGVILTARYGENDGRLKFFQVTRTTEKTAWYRPLYTKLVAWDESNRQFWVCPMMSHWDGEEKRTKHRGDRLKIPGYGEATPWSGKLEAEDPTA